MANLLSRRRTEPETPTSPAPSTSPAPPTPQAQPARPDKFATRIEKAANRAADAARTAAAAAAAERVRRPRISVLASLGLVVSVIAALAVASGTLTRLGIAIGAAGLLFGLAALATTRHHHRYLAGSTEAMVAVLLSLGAVVVGILAVSGQLSWLDPDTDNVARLRDWLPGWLD